MNQNSGTGKVREAIVSGIFYPDSAGELRKVLDEAFDAVTTEKGTGAAILSPHAGFEYSGKISATAWTSVAAREPKSVVILAPYHRAEEALVWLPESEIFQTPLGDVRVDRDYVDELESCGTIFRANDIPHFEEHGIEVQLPFLQRLFPRASIVPVLLGKPTPSTITSLAKSLSLVFSGCRDSVLFVVSSNFSCYATVSESVERFERVQGLIEKGDHEALFEEFRGDVPDMCGMGCLASLLRSRLVEGLSWNLLDKGDSASKRASPSEKVVYYAAGVWR